MRPRLTYANVISTLCLFLLLAGGTALATHPGGQNTISTGDIQNGEVKVADVGQGAVATDEIANGNVKTVDIDNAQVTAAKLAPNSVGYGKIIDGQVRNAEVATAAVRTDEIANGQVQAQDLAPGVAPGASGARAYARVAPDDCTPTTCIPRESKGISSVTVLQSGVYCVTAPGINGNVTPAAVTVDWQNTLDPEGSASAMTYEFAAAGCGPSGQGFRVATERQPEITVDAGGGVNNATAVGPAVEADDVAFTIVIP